MILRGAIFTNESRHLGAHPAPATLPLSESLAPVDAVQETSAVYEIRPELAPLSSERVASWLVNQDGATRTALAAVLGDDLAALRESARAEGYALGHAEAMREAREKVGGAVEALATLHEQAAKAFENECTQLQDACAEIVSEAFFKLAGQALVSPTAIVGVVGEVLKRVREARELRIHVNPQDLPLLRTAEAGIAASLPGRNYTLVADGRVETGGCIVESSLGSLDGRLEVQLAELTAVLRSARDPGIRA